MKVENLTKMDFSELKNELNNIKNAVILTHVSPDGDALGSSAALKILLGELGIHADCYLSEKIPRQYEFLAKYFTAAERVPFPGGEEESHGGVLIFFVDCAGKSRSGVEYPDNIKTCCIDHHISNVGDCDINIVDPSAAAAGELIYQLYRETGVPLSSASAEALYTALYTDTGGFSFSNTTKNSHLIAAELYDYNFDRDFVARKTMQEKSLTYSKLYAYIMSNLILLQHGEIAVGYIDSKIYGDLRASSDDVEGLSTVLRNIENVKCGILLTEKDKGVIKGSIRSNRDYDANSLASLFGGGGHIRAAGFRTERHFDEIMRTVNEWLYTDK